MATSIQKCIAMDLKFYKGSISLNLIDHATRLSVSSFGKSKEPEVILKAIFKSWIPIYGAPHKFLKKNAFNYLNPNAAQKSTESSQIRDKHNSHTILESESEDEIIQKIIIVTIIQPLKIIKEKPLSKTLTYSLKTALKELTT